MESCHTHCQCRKEPDIAILDPGFIKYDVSGKKFVFVMMPDRLNWITCVLCCIFAPLEPQIRGIKYNLDIFLFEIKLYVSVFF